ncbi:hypothetical protein AVEN_5368-1 [Araneus ventricosus]|uniref:Uncharacterized protein n=1 Tax=Araneus ventricosus TaxID=182803 RepID=A0A4Y2S795_ARAVE|nr:hypothetical protein AVEN_5368-1 [Araneus ventricosus]
MQISRRIMPSSPTQTAKTLSCICFSSATICRWRPSFSQEIKAGRRGKQKRFPPRFRLRKRGHGSISVFLIARDTDLAPRSADLDSPVHRFKACPRKEQQRFGCVVKYGCCLIASFVFLRKKCPQERHQMRLAESAIYKRGLELY